MTAPDKNVVAKPLHERIADDAEDLEMFCIALRSGEGKFSLRRVAANRLEAQQAELSRMRTALEGAENTRHIIVSRLRRLAFVAETTGGTAGPDAPLQIVIKEAKDLLGLLDAMDAAIAERALTAGSGNE